MKKKSKEIELKVLSVQQPWADLIVMGSKWCENRTWQTKHRGPLFIHASKWDVKERKAWEAEGVDLQKESPGGCETGAIIGYVHLYGCYPVELIEQIEEGQVPEGSEELASMLNGVSDESWQFVEGPWCWLMADARFLQTPIPAKGKLNVWKFKTEKSNLKIMKLKT